MTRMLTRMKKEPKKKRNLRKTLHPWTHWSVMMNNPENSWNSRRTTRKPRLPWPWPMTKRPILLQAQATTGTKSSTTMRTLPQGMTSRSRWKKNSRPYTASSLPRKARTKLRPTILIRSSRCRPKRWGSTSRARTKLTGRMKVSRLKLESPIQRNPRLAPRPRTPSPRTLLPMAKL